MNPDKFKSLAIRVDTYNKVREMADKIFSIPISMAKMNEYIIKKAHEEWMNKDKPQSEHPTKALLEEIFKK
jgi:hypothetical protein